MKLTKEIKTAILVISSILLFIWGYNFLKGKDILTNYKTFYVLYDNVEGLATSSPVTLNGLVVGKVNQIEYLADKNKIKVSLQIKGDYPISPTTQVALYQTSPIGGKQLMIIPNFNDKTEAPNESYLISSSKLGVLDKLSDKIIPLEEKVESMIGNADAMLININEVLDPKTKQNIRQSLQNLNEVLTEFNQASKTLNTILAENNKKISATASNLEKTTSNFAVISDSLKKADFTAAIKNLELTLNKAQNIMAGIEKGEGSMGKLFKDDKLYSNFVKTSKEIELLLQDVRLYPTRYVNVSLFGKKNKPYKAPDSTQIKK